MRRTILIIPHALAPEGRESLISELESALLPLVTRSQLSRLVPLEDSAVPEAAWLGINPSTVFLADGPLTVSALGVDPPERSVQFHLSVLSCDEVGVAHLPQISAPPEDMQLLLEQAEKLNTAAVTLVKGQGLDHGLVWEKGSLDLHTHTAGEVSGHALSTMLPEGEGERMLRRYIDDSVNLLSTLELNRRRADEGLPLLNLLWPWGQGIRVPMPNLAVQRGQPVWVESGSMRLAGLARMVRYRHGYPALYYQRNQESVFDLGRRLKSERSGIALLSTLENAHRPETRESALRWLRWVLDGIVMPLIEPSDEESSLDMLLPNGRIAPGKSTALGETDGLALHWRNTSHVQNEIPFDERAVEERRLPRRNVWEVVEEALCA